MARPEWHRTDTLLREGSSGRRGEGSWGLGTVTLISNYFKRLKGRKTSRQMDLL